VPGSLTAVWDGVRRRPRAAQAAIVTVVLGAVAVIMFLPHILHGGFYYDDWQEEARAHYGGFGGSFNFVLSLNNRRPVGAAYIAAEFTLFGSHEQWYHVLGALQWLGVAVLTRAVLRQLGTPPAPALAVAVLVLAFPSVDSVWLPATGGQVSFSVLALLAGVLLNLRGFAAGGRTHVLLRVAGILCLVVGVLDYELVLPASLVAGAVYFAVAPRRAALRGWVIDVFVVAAFAIVFTARALHLLPGTDTHNVLSASQELDHARLILHQAKALATASLVPFGSQRNDVVLGSALFLAAVVSALAVRSGPGPLRSRVRTGLLLGAAGVAIVALGYIMLIPSNDYYVPLQLGVGNRINGLAAVGYAMVVGGVATLAGALVLAVRPRWRAAPSALTLALCAVVAVGYLHRVSEDRAAWRTATEEQTVVLRDLRAAVPSLTPGTSIVTVGIEPWSAPGVPVFAATWDLSGAAELMYGVAYVPAYPSNGGTDLTCEGDAIVAPGSDWSAPYRSTVLVELLQRRAISLTSQKVCIRALAQASSLAS
jgi:predicted membrane channel-forming protein YqfA (hemolysin III family)